MRKEEIKKMHSQAQKSFGYTLSEVGDYRESWRIFRIMAEFVEGYQFLQGLDKEVTILGSARLKPDNKYYKIAQGLGTILSKNGYTVVTGGGPGIMEAANKGAKDAGGESVGLNIQLPFEQVLNPYVTQSASFYYFFTRKVMLTAPAHAFVFFPGGFGTLDEFFEVIDHIELGLMVKVPIVLVGSEYWTPVLDFVRTRCCKIGSVSEKQLDEIIVVDNAKDAFSYIKNIKEMPDICETTPDSFHCFKKVDWRIFRIMAELVEGFEFVTGMKNGVTVLGTKSLKSRSADYKVANKLGTLLAQQGYQVITGGKTGVAEAANKGAFEQGGTSVGIGLKSGEDPGVNKFLNKSILFEFPFTRKLIVTAPTKAFVVFEGGLGTLHQLFEILTLIQTQKVPKIPVILYGRKYWQSMHNFIKSKLVHDLETISDEDDELYQIVDDYEAILKAIKNYK